MSPAFSERSFSIQIDGEWTAHDANLFFQAINTLYKNTARIAVDIWNEINSEERKSILAGNSAGRMHALRLESMHYGSLGQIDFLGIGKLVEQMRLLIEVIVDRIIAREDREIDQKKKLLEIESLAIQNYGAWIEIVAKNSDFEDSEEGIRGDRLRNSFIASSKTVGGWLQMEKSQQFQVDARLRHNRALPNILNIFAASRTSGHFGPAHQRAATVERK